MSQITLPTGAVLRARIKKANSAEKRADIGWLGWTIIALGSAAALFFILGPLIMLLTTAFRGPQDLLPFEDGAQWTLSNLAAVYLDKSLYTNVLPNTLIFTAGSVTVTFIIAFILAWLVERTDLPMRNAVYTIILFPLLVPGIVLSITWIFLLAPNTGWINVIIRSFASLGDSGPLNIFSMGGMILAQGIGLVPFVFLLLSAALRSMNPSLEEASNTAGASPFTTIRKVTLPVLLPGLLAPLILATLITLEQFETPLVIGFPARINVFSTRIFFELNPDTDLPAYGRAAAVALPFLICGILLLLIYNHLIRRAESFVTVTGKGFRPMRFSLGRWRIPAIAFVSVYALFGAILPGFVLIWASLFGYALPTFDTLSTISFAGYIDLFNNPKFWLAARNTFIVAGASAIIVTSVGVILAWTILRTQLAVRWVLDFISFLSLGIPAVIAGLASMLLYLSLPIGVYGTVLVLILAYSYRMAVSTRLTRAALMQVHAELEEASSVSGAQWFTTIRRVVLPILTPSLVASFILLFIIGFREFTIPTILQSPDNSVLSVMMWQAFQGGKTTQAAAVGTMIVLFVIPIIFSLRRFVLARDGRD
jgi:iron(III) transport system permease protein